MSGEAGPQLPRFEPSGWRYDNEFVPANLLPRITDEEISFLLAGNSVRNPAILEQFGNVQAFQDGQNNFYVAFAYMPGAWLWIQQRRRLAFQRFELLYPEKVASLSDMPQQGRLTERPHAWWTALFDAYKCMTNLVSIDDPFVIQDGRVDRWYLCR